MKTENIGKISILVFSILLIITCVLLPQLSTLPRFNILSSEQLTNFTVAFCKVTETSRSKYRKHTQQRCSVPIYEVSSKQLYSYEMDNCSLCNRELLRKFHQQSTHFASQGSWNVFRSGGKIRHAYFRTPFCSFSHQDMSSSYLEKCFASQRVRRIMTLGDSNGRKTFNALKDIVSSSLQQCKMVKTEKHIFMPDMSYYLGPGTYNKTDIMVEKRTCRTCVAVQHQCYYRKGNDKQSLILEHIPMNFILEASIRIRNAIKNALPTDITHEFIFRDYLRDKMPDVILILTPCGHEWRKVLQGKKEYIKDALGQLVTNVKKYIPQTTQIYWVPYQYISLPNVSDAVHVCNEFIFETLRDDFKDAKSNMHATLDTFQLSCPFTEFRISNDPFHMKDGWYQLIGRQILEQMCNGLQT